jgi:hypothetical protein
VYWLGDMNWLHREGCPFWGVSLALDDEEPDGPGRGVEEEGGRSVVDVAEFEAAFWEVVGRVEFGEGGRKEATGFDGGC